MKKYLIPLIAAAFVAATSAVQAANTNIVQNISVSLEFTSPVMYSSGTYTNHSITNRLSAKATNFVFTTVSRAVSARVLTKDIISALLPGTTGASLVLVTQTNSQSSHVEIRKAGATLASIPQSALSWTPTASVNNSTYRASVTTVTNTTTGKLTTNSAAVYTGTALQIVTISLSTTNKLLFTATGLVNSTILPVSVSRIPYFVNSQKAGSVIGTGTDALGTGEIVTGSIVVGPPVAGF